MKQVELEERKKMRDDHPYEQQASKTQHREWRGEDGLRLAIAREGDFKMPRYNINCLEVQLEDRI